MTGLFGKLIHCALMLTYAPRICQHTDVCALHTSAYAGKLIQCALIRAEDA
jgi:hypothetical protein